MSNSEQCKTLPQGGTKSQISEPLSVKELAASLGVSLRFVYQMRACGFRMHGDSSHRQTATPEEARAWIKENNFRLIRSFGMIGKSVPVRVLSMPFPSSKACEP